MFLPRYPVTVCLRATAMGVEDFVVYLLEGGAFITLRTWPAVGLGEQRRSENKSLQVNYFFTAALKDCKTLLVCRQHRTQDGHEQWSFIPPLVEASFILHSPGCGLRLW